MDIDKAEAYTQVLAILDNMEFKYKAMIPKKLIKFLEKNKLKNYEFNIDLTIPLKEQNIKLKTKCLLAMLDLNYWCETEEKKQELLKLFYNNEEKYQEIIRQKYNTDNIFKTTKKEFNKEESMRLLIDHKESFFEKLIKKIKKILKMK